MGCCASVHSAESQALARELVLTALKEKQDKAIVKLEPVAPTSKTDNASAGAAGPISVSATSSSTPTANGISINNSVKHEPSSTVPSPPPATNAPKPEVVLALAASKPIDMTVESAPTAVNVIAPVSEINPTVEPEVPKQCDSASTRTYNADTLGDLQALIEERYAREQMLVISVRAKPDVIASLDHEYALDFVQFDKIEFICSYMWGGNIKFGSMGVTLGKTTKEAYIALKAKGWPAWIDCLAHMDSKIKPQVIRRMGQMYKNAKVVVPAMLQAGPPAKRPEKADDLDDKLLWGAARMLERTWIFQEQVLNDAMDTPDYSWEYVLALFVSKIGGQIPVADVDIERMKVIYGSCIAKHGWDAMRRKNGNKEWMLPDDVFAMQLAAIGKTECFDPADKFFAVFGATDDVSAVGDDPYAMRDLLSRKLCAVKGEALIIAGDAKGVCNPGCLFQEGWVTRAKDKVGRANFGRIKGVRVERKDERKWTGDVKDMVIGRNIRVDGAGEGEIRLAMTSYTTGKESRHDCDVIVTVPRDGLREWVATALKERSGMV